MIDQPVAVGIIGYGHFVRTNFIKRFRDCSSVRIAGVYNRGESRRREAEEDGFFATGQLDELLALPELEAVFIGTSNSAHRDQAIAAARAGKHIICEKPLSLSLTDVDQMVDEVDAAGVITHVNHARPFRAGMLVFKEVVEKHAGEILHYYERSSRGFGMWGQGARHVAVEYPEESGAWTFHHLCHALNNACMFTDRKPKRVFHLSQKSAAECPSEELVNALIEFEDNFTVMLADTTSIGGFHDIIVQGSLADVRLLGNTITIVKPGPTNETGRPGNLGRVEETIAVDNMGKPLEVVGHKFAQAIRGGKNELFSFENVRDQYRILEALSQSSRRGEAVSL